MSLWKELMTTEYADETKRIVADNCYDINPDFLGFTDIYEHLAEIIPKEYTVVDLGCAYNFQSYYFRFHKKYIAVNLPGNYHNKINYFKMPNTKLILKPIKDFLENYEHDDLEFAICSYVPNWGSKNMELVKRDFQNVFTYYPGGRLK